MPALPYIPRRDAPTTGAGNLNERQRLSTGNTRRRRVTRRAERYTAEHMTILQDVLSRWRWRGKQLNILAGLLFVIVISLFAHVSSVHAATISISGTVYTDQGLTTTMASGRTV